MNKYKELKNFFLTKYNFFGKNINNNENVLMVDRGRIDASIINSLLSLAVSIKYKSDIIILSDLSSDNLIIKIYKHLGFKRYIKGTNKIQYIKNYLLTFYSLIITLWAISNIKLNGFVWFIKNFRINKIPFGDLIYDTNIRFDHRYMSPQLDFKFIKLLMSSTFRILLVMKYFKKYKIKKVIVGTENYSFNSGVALRISIFKNIKNYYPSRTSDTEIEIGTDNKKKLYLGKDNIRNTLIKKNFKKFRPSKKEIDSFYLSRKNQTNRKFIWTLNSFKNANMQSKEGLKFLKQISKIKGKKILYASHAFSDAAHQKGLIYSFNDFYDQFISTLSYVYKEDNKNIWIFRSHPSSKIWNEDKYFKKDLKKFRKKNIFICPINVPIIELYKICDVVVTGSGTAGLEFICEGKNAVLAGCAAYSNNKLTPYYAKNKDQYFEYLKKIDLLKKTEETQINEAKKMLYFYESGKFITKKIDSDLIKKDRIAKKFFLNQFGMGLDQKDYIKLVHNMLSKNILKSKVFNKMVDLV